MKKSKKGKAAIDLVLAMIGNRRARIDPRYRAALEALCKAEDRGDIHAARAASEGICEMYTALKKISTATEVIAGLTDEDLDHEL